MSKLYSALLMFAFFISCTSSKKTAADNFTSSLEKSTLFSGFQILQTPRENINIGAQWLQGQGPIDMGMTSDNLFTSKSVSDYEFQNDKNFNVGLKTKLLGYLGVDIGYNSFKNLDLKITEAEITRVNDISKLNYSSGKAFVWEGLKVKSFSLVTSSQKGDTIAASMQKADKLIDISVSQGADNSKKLNVSGLNLYLAYRLVSFGDVSIEQFDRPKETTKKVFGKVTITTYPTDDDIIYQDSRHVQTGKGTIDDPIQITTPQITGFKIGAKYEGKIYTNEDYEKFVAADVKKSVVEANPYNQCNLVLLITCYNDISYNKPKQVKFNLDCNNHNAEEYIIPLSSKLSSDTYLIEDLIFRIRRYAMDEKFPFPVNEGYKSKNLIYRKRTVPIIRYVDPTKVSGW